MSQILVDRDQIFVIHFPQNYHEPYFASYIDEDFAAVGRQFGLVHKRDVKAFVSKVIVLDKIAVTPR